MRLLLIFILLSCGTAFAKAKTQKPKAEPNWREAAALELSPQESDYSKESLPSPATVATTLHDVKSPIIYQGLQLGIRAQMYRPSGQMRVIGLNNYDAATLGSQLMFHAQLRWLPWSIKETGVGFYGSVGYAQHPVTLRGASGLPIGSTKIHTALSQAGLTAEHALPVKNMSIGADLGVGRLDQVQASEVQTANVSERSWLSSVGASLRYRKNSIGVALGYDRQSLLGKSSSGLTPQADNVSLGVLVGFR